MGGFVCCYSEGGGGPLSAIARGRGLRCTLVGESPAGVLLQVCCRRLLRDARRRDLLWMDGWRERERVREREREGLTLDGAAAQLWPERVPLHVLAARLPRQGGRKGAIFFFLFGSHGGGGEGRSPLRTHRFGAPFPTHRFGDPSGGSPKRCVGKGALRGRIWPRERRGRWGGGPAGRRAGGGRRYH